VKILKYNKEIKKIMIDEGINQKELAKRTGINQSTLSATFAGERNWTVNKIEKVLDALGYELQIVKKENK